MTRRLGTTLALLLLVVPAARADENRGLKLLHEARAAAQRGDMERARTLLDDARIEWPGSALIAHELGDQLLDDGAWDAALAEYRKGSGPPYSFRAAFNSGVVRSRRAEAGLAEAGVPLDPQALGDVAQPGPLLAAIDAAAPELKAARRDFLEALAEHADERARDSVAALTQRLDELAEMRERLQQQQDEQDQQQDDQDQQDDDEQDQDDQQDQQDPQDQDDGQQDPQDPGDQQPPQDPPPQGGQDQQPPPDEEPSDDDSGDDSGDEEQQPPEPDAAPEDDPGPQEPTGADDPDPAEARPEIPELTPQQLQQLLDALDELEAEARRIEAMTRAANRRSVEKDW